MAPAGGPGKVDFATARPDKPAKSRRPPVIPFPDIAPEVFSVTIFDVTLALRWYALAYIGGLLIAWAMVAGLMRAPRLWPGGIAPTAPRSIEHLLTWCIIGVILGGRLGYVLFYKPAHFLANPAEIIAIWEGGMAFHGGFLGVVAAAWLWAGYNGVPRLELADAIAYATPPGIVLGRIANFINAELWGHPTTLPWGVVFPGAAAQDCPGVIGPCARHPSQLYAAALEGLVLGIVLALLVWRGGWLRRPGAILGVFLAGYGVARFTVEFFRQADAQFITPDNPLGHVLRFGDWGITMGQTLSLPMIAVGLVFLVRAWRRAAA
jgi:phosphatidylglycerol:prolipoprotein diacylglycerol transferase